MAISKDTLDSDTFSAFFSLINSNISNPHGTSKWVFSSYPDEGYNTSSDFPIIIIRDIEPQDEKEFTMNKNVLTVEVTIEALATSKVSSYNYLDEVFKLINSKRQELRNNEGIKRIKLVSTDTDAFERGKIKLHSRSKTFTFELTYTKEPGY